MVLKEGIRSIKEAYHTRVEATKLRNDKRKAVELFSELLKKYAVSFTPQDIQVDEHNLQYQPNKPSCTIEMSTKADDASVRVGFGGDVRRQRPSQKLSTHFSATRAHKEDFDEYATLTVEETEGEEQPKFYLWIHHGTSGSRFEIDNDGNLDRPISAVFKDLFKDISPEARIDFERTMQAFIHEAVDVNVAESLAPIVWVESDSTED